MDINNKNEKLKIIDDKYDISTYTDNELYDILDLNNPSDRELEAKILHMINKYANLQNESGYKLAVFFQNIYYHFFDTEEDNQNKDIEKEYFTEKIQEGFDTQNLFINKGTTGTSKVGNELVNKTTKQLATATDIINTTNFNYTEDKFGLNPLLKQTITRIISIDSQYRDNKSTSISTDFNLNLSEPLRDVVSLKLESIQLPITWYTISKNYGANFFILKGKSDGINTSTYNGFHDYKIEIPPGNYVLESTQPNYIITTLNQAITDLSNANIDTNFGTTKVSFDLGQIKTTIKLDIQKTYDESYFNIDFSKSWSPSANPSISDISQNELNLYRSKTIASYLGFNDISYCPFTINSNKKYYKTEFLNSDNRQTFTIDDSNNTINIIQYENITEKIINIFPIKINNGTWSRELIQMNVSYAIQSSNIFDSSYSSFEKIDIIDTSNINYSYSHYRMRVKINRYTVKPVPYTNYRIVFPDETNLNRDTVWTKNKKFTNYKSCFFFDNLINELNTIRGESPHVFSNISVNNSTYLYFKCISPPEYASINDFSKNDIIINIPQGNYSISQYINTFTYQLQSQPGFTTNSFAVIDKNNFLNINLDFTKEYTNDTWKIYIDQTSILTQIFGISSGIHNLQDLSNNNYNLTNTRFIQTNKLLNTFNTQTTKILTYSPNQTNSYTTNGNENEISRDINIPTTTYSDWTALKNQINNELRNFKITDSITNNIYYPLSQSSIASTLNNDQQTYTISLNLNIKYYLTEQNYEIQFQDLDTSNNITDPLNSWKKLNIDFSYNINNLLGNQTNQTKLLTSKSSIDIVQLTLDNTTNTININPFYDKNGGADTIENYFELKLTQTTYTTNSLLIELNNMLLYEIPKLYGSYFSLFYDDDGNEYVQLVININIIYTTKDYSLIFYDTNSFINCYVGSKSVRNTSWDSTLGWILGFHDYTDYILTKQNQTTTLTNSKIYLDSTSGEYTYNDINSITFINNLTNTIITLTGDTTTTTNIYNYFLIVLDDYIQNHLNDGLVSITSSETSIPLPSYASLSTSTLCDPTTYTTTTISTTNKDGLTQKQIYALNQSRISQMPSNNIYSKSPNVQDVFGVIPLRIAGQKPGTYYVEAGGNLQNQSRYYFGPVNINRISVKLQNDKGDIVDLNKSNWSFTLLCEQLYRK